MIFAYVRVSTKDQNLDRQINAINDYALKENIVIDRIFEEYASGKNFDRDIYKSLKNILKKGDILIIKELDRLGRHMGQIKTEWEYLQSIGIEIIVVDTPILNTRNKTDLEKTLIHNIIFEIMIYLAQKEREKIKIRQAEGISIAKQQGKYKGRKPKQIDSFKSIYESWKRGEITAVKAMEILSIPKATFYRHVKKYEESLKL